VLRADGKLKFNFRNVTDDHELRHLVTRARELLQGVEADDLRTVGDMRTQVQQDLAAALDGMLTKPGQRKLRLIDAE
jgi:hypothetical protein